MSAGWREGAEERRVLSAERLGHVSRAGDAGQRREPPLLLRRTSFSLHKLWKLLHIFKERRLIACLIP